jgi:F-type H+-transporting ATPase subunit b
MSLMNTLIDVVVPVAWAAGESEAHSSSVIDLVFPLINFLIFVYLAKRYAIPPIKEYLKQRREGIISAVAEANEAKNRAEKYLQTYKTLLNNLEAETEKLRQRLRAEGEREKARIIAAAQEFAAKLKADTDFMAEQEMKMARQQIREELANLAEEAAERVIARQLTDHDQDRLIDDFTQHLRS